MSVNTVVQPVIGAVDAPDLQIMTFNIRRRMNKLMPSSPDLWSRRQPAVRALLRTEQPTVLGLQECLPSQTAFVAESLGLHYEHIGYGRNADKDGEQTPMFYDTRRLRLTDWTQFALSDTPSVPGSRGWGNITPRMAVSAYFTDIATGARFHVVNTHFDQMSLRARMRSARMISRVIADAALPGIVTGDFNTSVDTDPYEQLTIGGQLRDSWFAAKKRLTENWGSFPNYREPQLERKRIDWILVSRGVQVRAAAINSCLYAGAFGSDHLPVQAVVRVP